MNRIIYICIMFTIFVSCAQKKETPSLVEGKVIGVSMFANIEEKNIVSTVTVQDTLGKFFEAEVPLIEAEKMFRKIQSNFQSNEPNYVRLEKSGNKYTHFSIKEEAVMSYDYGTPAVYIFTSDKKIAGHYKK